MQSLSLFRFLQWSLGLAFLCPTLSHAAVTTTGGFYGGPGQDIWVGYSSDSTMLIDGGSNYSANVFSVGYNRTGTVTLSGTGSTLTTNKSVFLGSLSGGHGQITIQDGAVMTSLGSPVVGNPGGTYRVVIGNAAGGSGSVIVDGAGSRWILPELNIGMGTAVGSEGSLTIRNGGNVTFGTGGMTLGYGSDLLVTGVGSTLQMLSSNQIAIWGAVDRAATVTISAGGVMNSAGLHKIGVTESRPGSVTVTGVGSRWNIAGTLSAGNSSGKGTLTVADGAILSVSLSGVANEAGTGFESNPGDGIVQLGSSPQSTTPGTPVSEGTLRIGTGGAAGILNAREVFGYYSTSQPGSFPSIASLIFDHHESDHQFRNLAGESILVSGTTRVRNVAGTTVFTAANTYFGGTEIDGGGLIVNNTTGSGTGTGSVVVEEDGTLGGAGIVAPSGTSGITVAGRLAPGNTERGGAAGSLKFDLDPGARLTFEEGSILTLNLVGGGISDSIHFLSGPEEGQSWLSGLGNLTLELRLSGLDVYDQTYVIFANADNLPGLPEFTLAGITGYDEENYLAIFAKSDADYLLYFQSIPEPTSLMLLTMAGLLLCFRRRAWRPFGK